MKIEKIIIYGFGKHENVTVEFGEGMNVLYGLNEAGKTTIQQFILHVLFGFPQRNSAGLRYEPKSGGKYGGRIQLMDKEYGRCLIERIRGKSAGDVTVYFEDGTTGEEDSLKKILRQYDRTSFESIFSFSLLQLQNFEKMDEDELSRTLLASGTTGVDSLIQVGNKMEKEMGNIFKKSGKNPEMNIKMTELRNLAKELKDEQEKIAGYAPSMKRIHDIDIELNLLNKEQIIHKKRLQHLSVAQQILPLQIEKKELEKKLTLVGRASFPPDGIRRFESLSGKLTETIATKQRIENDLAELKIRLPKNIETERLKTAGVLLAKESEWLGWQSSVAADNDELQRLKSLKYRLLDRLGVREEEVKKVLFDADVSIRKEEEMYELLNGINETNTQLAFLETQLVNIENELTAEKANSILAEVPSGDQLKKTKEWPEIRQKLAEAKAYVSFEGSGNNKNIHTLPIILFVLAVAFLSIGIIQNEMLIIVISIIMGGLGFYFYSKKGTSNNSKLNEMETFINKYDNQEYEMEKLIVQIEDYNRDKKKSEEVITILEQKLNKLEDQRRKLRIESDRLANIFDEFISSYGFDGLPSTGIVTELFRMIREVQEARRDMTAIENHKQVIERKIVNRTEEVEEILQYQAPIEAVYELLRKEYNEMSEKLVAIRSIKASIERFIIELREANTLLSLQQENLKILLNEANVESEEDFYSSYDKNQKSRQLKEKLASIENQISASGSLILEGYETQNELQDKIEEIKVVASAIDEKVTTLIYDKALLVTKTESLVADETYSQKLQLFEMKKAELTLFAKKWSARKAILEAINQTMSELKEEKLPEVLHGAEKIFSELTSRTYVALVVTEEGTFEVISASGIRFPIVELSQATKEQAYISLRLSLAQSVLKSAPFPILMDDPFVHFDEERLSRMIGLLGAIKSHQFIYFTCHSKMKNKWADSTIINVSEIGDEQEATIQ